MTDDLAPPLIGTAALTGRADPAFGHPAAIRGEPELEERQPEGPRQAMPPQCLRRLTIPARDGDACASSWGTCPGIQRDGGCLLDIVRAARAAGVHWLFEIDPHDGYWDYAGPPIPGLEVRRGDYGQIHTRWLPGHEPDAPEEALAPPQFACPHCGALNEQDPANFHWWCAKCGKNAKEA